MKKGVIIGLLVILGLSPWLLGSLAQSRVNQIVDQLDQNPMYKVGWLSYEKGWFSSHGVVEIEVAPFFTGLSENVPIEPWTLDLVVQHGPFFLKPHLGLGLASWTLSSDFRMDTLDSIGADSLFHLKAVTGFTGTTVFTAEVDEINPVEGVQIGVVSIEGVSKGVEIELNLNFEGLDISTPEFSVSMDPLNLTYAGEVSLSSDKIAAGTSRMTLDGLRILGPEIRADLSQLEIQSELTKSTDDRLLDSVVSLSIDSFALNETALENVDLQYSFENYSVDVVETGLKHLVAQIENQMPVTQSNQWDSLFDDKLALFLQENPSTRLDHLAFDLDGASFHLSGLVEFFGVEAGQDVSDPAFGKNHLIANATLQMDKALMQRVLLEKSRNDILIFHGPQSELTEMELQDAAQRSSDMLLKMLLEQELLMESETGYSVSFELVNGEGQLNGNQVPLPF